MTFVHFAGLLGLVGGFVAFIALLVRLFFFLAFGSLDNFSPLQ